jgi:hypothetical protein
MTDTTTTTAVTCRSCKKPVDPRLQICPECGACCPGCSADGLQVRVSDTPATRRLAIARSSPCGKLLALHEELGHALMEAVWEMDNLPVDTDEALARIYAVMDDLEQAIDRTKQLDEEMPDEDVG